MPLITITGDETPAEGIGKHNPSPQNRVTFQQERKIWENSSIILEAFVNLKGMRSKVHEGFASESISVSLDPGWYRYKCVAIDQFNERHQFVNQFFVQITYEMFRQYAGLRPMHAKPRQTSSGATWICGFPQCRKITSSKYAIIDHEKRHMGESIFKDISWRPDEKDGRLYSNGILILGGIPEGATDARPSRTVALPPVGLMEEAPEAAPVPKRRGRPPKARVEEPILA